MLKLILVAVVSTMLGAIGGIAFVDSRASIVPKEWIQLSIERQGYGWTDAAITSDIQIPRVTAPKGRAKFLDREAGIELGYLITVPVAKLDVSKLSAKYRQSQKLAGGLELEPTEEVDYKAHFEFILKDADGFELMTVSSAPVDVLSGQENLFQGSAKERVPLSVVKRTKNIQMQMTLDKCETCF